MIKSMTGFGQCVKDDGRVQITAEVRSLNAKFLDLSLRLPKVFAEREMEVRGMISETLERGKVSLTVEFQRTGEAAIQQSYNKTLFAAYYSELKKLADHVMAPYDQLFELALNSPDVVQNKVAEGVNEAEWQEVKMCISEALAECDRFRCDEGSSLESMLKECGGVIGRELQRVEALDPQRVERIRARLKGNVINYLGEEGYDTNRLEQEIIFYIEKLDINEEKVRLRSHLEYFDQILQEKQSSGKKLGFISQEIGREINTIGSKASDAAIQKHVVVMKEELEKIKEQLNNVV